MQSPTLTIKKPKGSTGLTVERVSKLEAPKIVIQYWVDQLGAIRADGLFHLTITWLKREGGGGGGGADHDHGNPIIPLTPKHHHPPTPKEITYQSVSCQHGKVSSFRAKKKQKTERYITLTCCNLIFCESVYNSTTLSVAPEDITSVNRFICCTKLCD